MKPKKKPRVPSRHPLPDKKTGRVHRDGRGNVYAKQPDGKMFRIPSIADGFPGSPELLERLERASKGLIRPEAPSSQRVPIDLAHARHIIARMMHEKEHLPNRDDGNRPRTPLSVAVEKYNTLRKKYGLAPLSLDGIMNTGPGADLVVINKKPRNGGTTAELSEKKRNDYQRDLYRLRKKIVELLRKRIQKMSTHEKKEHAQPVNEDGQKIAVYLDPSFKAQGKAEAELIRLLRESYQSYENCRRTKKSSLAPRYQRAMHEILTLLEKNKK